MKYFIQGLTMFVLVLFVSSTNITPELPKNGYWAMEGTLITHIFEDKTDLLSGPEIYELQDADGLTIWFCRNIYKDVCMTGVCKMIRLWVFWDGAGNYLGIQTLNKEPLTKSDHTLFEDTDYTKLDDILKDTASILKTMNQVELIIVPDTINPFEIDGYSAATQPALTEVIVKDAVYTCHTLWHTVHGPSQKSIENILEQRLSNEYLTTIFATQETVHISWAIKTIEKHPAYHKTFYMQIMYLIRSNDSLLSKQALDYFKPMLLEDDAIQYQLVQLIPKVDLNIKYDILWKLIEYGDTNEVVVLNLLKMFNNQNIGMGTYNLILKLITPEHIKENDEIARIITNMSEHENGYIRNLSRNLLEKQNGKYCKAK